MMCEIQISLPDAAAEFAGAQVKSGRFSSVNDYFIALVKADQFSQGNLDQLSQNPKLERLLEDGIQSGHGGEWNSDVLAKIKQQVIERAAGNGS